MNISREFLSRIDSVAKKNIPDEVIARAKRSLLDYLAVTCAGTEFQKEKMDRYFDFAEPESGKYKAIGLGKDLALKEAVFLNGLNGHALDFDDGTNSGIIHLGSPIFSLLIPLAQKYDISIDPMLRAAVIGYEASYTMAVSIQPGHKALGYHATGTCGVLGATIAATYMLGMSDEMRFQAFSAACMSASGMLRVLDEGSELKPYNVAKTALLSLTSLQLAVSGFEGPEDPLGGRGYLKMMTGREDIVLKPVLLNGSYAIMKSYTKPYASCRYTHPPVEAAIQLRNELDVSTIEDILIETYDLAVAGHDHTEVPGSYSAKMSTPYATAAALLFGKAGLQEFTEEAVQDPETLALTRKIHVLAKQEFSTVFPGKQIAMVTIRTPEGTFTKQVDFPKGEPENPLTDDEFRSRYNELMRFASVSPAISDTIYALVSDGSAKVSTMVEGL